MKDSRLVYNENIKRINVILNGKGNPNHDKSTGEFSTSGLPSSKDLKKLQTALDDIEYQDSIASDNITSVLRAKEKYRALVKEVSAKDTKINKQVKPINGIDERNKQEFVKDYKEVKYGGEKSYYTGIDAMAGIKREDYIITWDEPTLAKGRNILGWYQDYPQLLITLDSPMKSKLRSVLKDVTLMPHHSRILE